MHRDWVVEANGLTWTDRLANEAECLFNIQDGEETHPDKEFTYRLMSDSEIQYYDRNWRPDGKEVEE